MPKSRNNTVLNRKLINAACEGRTGEFKGLLDAGADINALEESTTALVAATVCNQPQAVRTLLELGARVDLPDAHRLTPLSYAVLNQRPDIIQLLLESGADLNTTYDNGDNLLTAAVKIRDQPTVDKLIEFQADVHRTNSLGQSALALASRDTGMVRSLLDAKADLTHAANQDALVVAVIYKLTDTAQLLLSAGANPNAVDDNGKAVLTHAAEQGDARLVRSLIAANADPNEGANRQALEPALVAPDTAVLAALLEADACPDLAEPAGHRVLREVFRLGIGQAAVQWIPENSAPQAGDYEGEVYNPMTLAVEVGTVDIIEILRDAGYGADGDDDWGHSVLMLACARRSSDVVDALLQTRNGYPGANPNARAYSDGTTPLMVAAASGSPATIKLLLDAGADPTVIDTAGRTALDYAGRCPSLARADAVWELLSQAITTPAWQEWKDRMDDIDANPGQAMCATGESAPATVNDFHDGAEPMELEQSTIPSLWPYPYI